MHATHSQASRRAAAAVLGAAALIGSLVAFPSAASAAPLTTVRGIVTEDGHAVPGAPVGTWSPTKGVVATARTGADGRFTLHSPSGVAVVAYAGSKPSAAQAVFALGAEHLVRGVIGATAPKHLAGALQQRVTRAVPTRLGGGHALRFRLQEAGRFTASSPVLGTSADVTGVIMLQHGDSNYSPEFAATADGDVTSGWLVPGRYHLVWNGKALLERTWVTVRSGETVVAPAPTFRTGATVRLHVTSGGSAVPEGVPAVRVVSGGVASGPSTDATGTITLRGLEPGTYRYTVGQFFDDPDEGLEGPPSSDDYLTRTVTVRVATAAGTVDQDVDLAPASKVSGSIVAPAGATTGVLVEDAAGNIVRRGTVVSGAISVAGLPAGTYRVFAVDQDRHRYDVETVVLPTASSPADPPTALARPLEPTTPELVLSGTVRGATEGYVALQAAPTHGAVLYAAFGRVLRSHGSTYRLRTIPGRLRLAVLDEHHVDRTAAYRSVTASAKRTLRTGASTAAVAVRFTVQGHVVAVDAQVVGTGGTELVLSRAARGRSTAHGVAPGRYTWSRTSDPLPATDGPWYYGAPKGSFTVHAGGVTHLGTKRIAILG
jgi:hypothetical protein